MVYAVAAVSSPVDFEPLVASVPDQPPEAAQEVALADDQVNFVLAPVETLAGLALSVTVGGELAAAADSEVAVIASAVSVPTITIRRGLSIGAASAVAIIVALRVEGARRQLNNFIKQFPLGKARGLDLLEGPRG
jgi:hypothetical protein